MARAEARVAARDRPADRLGASLAGSAAAARNHDQSVDLARRGEDGIVPVLISGRGGDHVDRIRDRGLRQADGADSRRLLAEPGTQGPRPRRRRAHDPRPSGVGEDAHRPPSGSGWFASSEARSAQLGEAVGPITLAWRNSAPTVTSEAASMAPVWELVARAPAGVRPLFTATIGFERPTRARRVRRSRSLNDSM